MTNTALHSRRERLESLITSYGTLAVAFSGGVDSTLLAKVAHDILGDRVLAITVDSEAYPPASIEETRCLARDIGIRLVELPARVTEIQGFVKNEPDRCYHCKKALFSLMRDKACELGFNTIADGSNVDDLADYRPGELALEELGVRSPLKEAGFTKQDIRLLSRELGLPTWNRQSYACLASRFPYGTAITPALLNRIGKAEEVFPELGFSHFRVRHHGPIARIEVAPGELPLLFEGDNRKRIISHLKSLGYSYITVDLEGYRSGSMNEVLDETG
ncbi:ATP-dependent sacrificial sulfur transferase LarE [Candidatus Latescibacterota bacterium]